jgi:hypothetical protein
MKTRILVFNTVTANGADVSTSNGFVNITGSASGESVSFKQSELVAIRPRQARVAGTAQVSTGAITAANNATYIVGIEATNKVTGSPQDFVYSYVSDAGGTAAEICNAFVTAINADNRISVVASNVADDLVLTGEAPYYTFTARNANPGSTTIAFTTGTPGVIGWGLGSLIMNTEFNDSNLVSTNNYTTFIFTYEREVPRNADTLKKETVQVAVFINEAATGYSAMGGALGTLNAALTGYSATWSAAAATGSTVTNGVLTLGGADVFYGNADVNVGLIAGDYILIGAVGYQLASILSGTTAATASIPNDATIAETRYIQWRKI